MTSDCTKAECKARKKVLQIWLKSTDCWPHLGSLCATLTLRVKVFVVTGFALYPPHSNPPSPQSFFILSRGRLNRILFCHLPEFY